MSETPIENMSVEQLDAKIAHYEGALGISTEKPPAPSPEKPTLFEHGSDTKLTDELGKIFDRVEARTERTPQRGRDVRRQD